MQALEQVIAAGIEGGAQHGGIGQGEIGGCDGVDELTGIELHLARGFLVQPFHLAHQSLQAAGGEQIGLLDEVKDHVLRPFLVLETLVAGGRLDQRCAVLTEQAIDAVLPQIQMVFPQLDLGFEQWIGVFQQLFEQLLE